ncbi:MAG: DUF262 domain-containing protein [Candidatus Poribacteria bacterium]|nr:DUF262 domain-containing protein [Candidatus Poribacteria bacterium]
MLLGENSDNLHALFVPDVQYQVPRYQRRYIWDETNWSMLWEDILSQGKLAFKDRGHFTGNIVTRPIVGGRFSIFEVIDGQQRLATFQIIFCVIRDMCKSNSLDGLASEAEKHLVNAHIVIQENTLESDLTYKFLPTEYDKSTFQAMIMEKYDPFGSQVFDEGEMVSHSILNAYDYFKKAIIAYVGKDCNESKMRDLVSSIKSDFKLIHITLGSSDQPEKIFESLNATGRMLSEFDYLRNHLFLRAGNLGKARDSGDSYNDIFYDKYWIFESDSRYWNVNRQDLFFRGFLIAKLGPECLESENVKPFEAYRQYSKTLTDGIEHEFRQLRDYAQSYKELEYTIPVSNDSDSRKLGNRMRFYDALNIPRLDSFILFLRHSHGLKDIELRAICDILESYIVRRMLCCDDTNSCAVINNLFSEAIKEVKFCKQRFAETLQEELPDPSNDYFSLNSALSCAWLKDDNLIRYILYRVELFRRQIKGGSWESLNFGDLKVQVRIVSPISGVSYRATESIGNIIPLSSEPDENWDSFAIDCKQQLLSKLAPNLELPTEIANEAVWVSDPETQITNRTGDLLYDFDKIWKPVLTDYI